MTPDQQQTDKPKRIWIGMVEVRSTPDSKVIADAEGAFFNVLTWAVDRDEFWRKVLELMEHLRLQLINVERSEPLANRGDEGDYDEEIAGIADEVRHNPNAIMYGTFHTWSGPLQ